MVEANCNRGVCSRSLQRMSNHARGSLEPGSIMRKLSMTNATLLEHGYPHSRVWAIPMLIERPPKAGM